MPYKKQTRNNWIQEQAEENIRELDKLMGITPVERAFLDTFFPEPPCHPARGQDSDSNSEDA